MSQPHDAGQLGRGALYGAYVGTVAVEGPRGHGKWVDR
jgi:hypothetical protein